MDLVFERTRCLWDSQIGIVACIHAWYVRMTNLLMRTNDARDA